MPFLGLVKEFRGVCKNFLGMRLQIKRLFLNITAFQCRNRDLSAISSIYIDVQHVNSVLGPGINRGAHGRGSYATPNTTASKIITSRIASTS